jgi:hypothetical protein
MQPPELLEFIRRNLTTFVDHHPDGCVFSPYDPLIDTAAWLPPFLPLPFVGAVLSIDLISNHVNVDDGSVVLSAVAPDSWTFSTLWTPNDLNHPVSGNRQFGFVPGVAGESIFYTRGADRVTTWVDDLAADIVFTAGHRVWISFQKKVAAFVNSNGGLATIIPAISNRYDWSTVQASYHHPMETWV